MTTPQDVMDNATKKRQRIDELKVPMEELTLEPDKDQKAKDKLAKQEEKIIESNTALELDKGQLTKDGQTKQDEKFTSADTIRYIQHCPLVNRFHLTLLLLAKLQRICQEQLPTEYDPDFLKAQNYIVECSNAEYEDFSISMHKAMLRIMYSQRIFRNIITKGYAAEYIREKYESLDYIRVFVQYSQAKQTSESRAYINGLAEEQQPWFKQIGATHPDFKLDDAVTLETYDGTTPDDSEWKAKTPGGPLIYDKMGIYFRLYFAKVKDLKDGVYNVLRSKHPQTEKLTVTGDIHTLMDNGEGDEVYDEPFYVASTDPITFLPSSTIPMTFTK